MYKLVIYCGEEEFTASCHDMIDVEARFENYYRTKSEVCVGELLAQTYIEGASIEAQFEFYSRTLKEYEGDTIIQAQSESCSDSFWESVNKEEQNGNLKIIE